MDDSIKKYLEEGDRLKKLTEGLDTGKKLKSLGVTDSISKHLASLDLMKNLTLPSMPIPEPIRMPRIPTFEENNHFQNSGVLLRRLADSITQWRSALPEDVQPAIIAILHGGIQIDVERLAQDSFHGIRIEGRTQGSPCVVLAHQATVQLLCFVQAIQPPERPSRPIGFVIDGEESQA